MYCVQDRRFLSRLFLSVRIWWFWMYFPRRGSLRPSVQWPSCHQRKGDVQWPNSWNNRQKWWLGCHVMSETVDCVSCSGWKGIWRMVMWNNHIWICREIATLWIVPCKFLKTPVDDLPTIKLTGPISRLNHNKPSHVISQACTKCNIVCSIKLLPAIQILHPLRFPASTTF